MKTKTPDHKNRKTPKKNSPQKTPGNKNKVEIIEMDTSSLPKIKSPKTPKLSATPTPKIFHSRDDSDDEKTEIKIPKKRKTPKPQTPNMTKIKTPKLETPKIRKMKTPGKSPNLETEFPTPQIKKVKTPKVEVKTPKVEMIQSAPRMEKLKTPKSLNGEKSQTPKISQGVKNKTPKTPRVEEMKIAKTPNVENVQTPKKQNVENVKTMKTPNGEKVKIPKTTKSEIKEKNSESIKNTNRKRKQPRKDEDEEEKDASPKKKDRKGNNKENTLKRKNNNNIKERNSNKDKRRELITVVVTPLEAKTRAGTVREFFTERGVNVHQIRKKSGTRFGHMDLLTSEDLEKAMSLSGQSIDGREMNVYKQKEHFIDKMTKLRSQMILVKNIENSVTLEELEGIFPDAFRIRYPKTIDGVPKGFAHVMFESSEKVSYYTNKKNQLQLKGQTLAVTAMIPDKCPSNILHIKNLNFKTKAEDLEKVFPTSTSIQIRLNRFNKSQGKAFVTMRTIREAKAALDEKNGTTVDGFQIVVSFYTGSDQKKDLKMQEKRNGVPRKNGIPLKKKILDQRTKKSSDNISTKPKTLKPGKKTLKPSKKGPKTI